MKVKINWYADVTTRVMKIYIDMLRKFNSEWRAKMNFIMVHIEVFIYKLMDYHS